MTTRDDPFLAVEPDEDALADDPEGLPEEVQAELEALAEADRETPSVLEQALEAARRELEAQRAQTQRAVARYREALLAAEPDLPPDLVRGESIEEVDEAARLARETVARIRERVEAARRPERGFPVGAPARGFTYRSLSAAEKIAAGLREREP
jgi:hypothetical protein